jgi:acyl carrier protein
MKQRDKLRELLTDFFSLPAETPKEELSQKALPTWDSLAMVQLIGELQSVFAVDFSIDEIQVLRSYDEIRSCLAAKGIDFAADGG